MKKIEKARAEALIAEGFDRILERVETLELPREDLQVVRDTVKEERATMRATLRRVRCGCGGS